MGMPACVCARLFVFVSMGWKIEFGPCHGKKGGAGGRALWVLGGGSASTAKDESRQFCQLSGG